MNCARIASAVLLVFVTIESRSQTLSWKKDHVYANGNEIAVITPPPSDTTAPTAPTSLAATNTACTYIDLSWNGSTDNSGGSGLSGYVIYRQKGTGASLPITTVGPGVTSYRDAPLQWSTQYTYVVRAIDNAQNSTPSSALTVSSYVDTTAPPTPSGFAFVNASGSSVQSSWSSVTDTGCGLRGYRVYRDGTLVSGTDPVTMLTFTDPAPVNAGGSYAVKALDNLGNLSGESTSRSFYRDDFNRANATDLSNSNWTSSGNWYVKDGYWWWSGYTMVYSYYPTPATIMTMFNGAWTEAVANRSFSSFQATVHVGPGITGYGGMFFWGGTDGEKYRVYSWGGRFYVVHYAANGTETELGSYISGVLTSNTIRVEASSATRAIKVYVDGTLRINVTDSNTAHRNTGLVGITGKEPSNGSGGVDIDDFLVEETDGF